MSRKYLDSLTLSKGSVTGLSFDALISGDVTDALGYTPGTSSFSGAFSALTGIPTTVAGYGITDVYTKTSSDARYDAIGAAAAAQAASQPLDSDLTAIAALSTVSFGRGGLIQADAPTFRTYIGAGTSSFSGAFSALSGVPTTIAGYGITDPIVLTSGSYANPGWITSLVWSKITSAPTTLAGYGITDAYTKTAGDARYGRALFDDYASAGNTHTDGTDDDLYTHSIVAGQLGTNGDKLQVEQGGNFVSSVTATRRIKLWFAGTAIFDTGALTLSLSSAWTLYATLIRVSATVIRYQISLATEGAALAAYTGVGELTGLTLSGANTLKSTGAAAGAGAAANDVVALLGDIVYLPVGS